MHRELDSIIFGVHLCHKLQHLMVVSVTCHDSKIYPVPMQVWQNLLGAAKHKCYKSVLRHFNNLNNPVPNEWWKSVNETCWKLGVPKLEIWRPNNCQISSPKTASLWPPTIAKLPQNGKLSHLSGEILLLNCPLEYHFSRNSPFFVSKKKSPDLCTPIPWSHGDSSWVKRCQKSWIESYHYHTKWGPQTIAKLVQITPVTMVYGTYNYIVNGVYKPSYNWGWPHCIMVLS